MSAKVKKLADHAKKNKIKSVINGFKLIEIEPLTDNQEKAFDYWEDNYNLVLRGSAGTGKTFLACFLAMSEFDYNDNLEQVVIIRSAVPSRDLGFMGGKRERDKIKEYERTYIRIFSHLYERNDAFNQLFQRQIVKFISTSFLRGDEFANAIVIVDEFQNMNDHELNTILTRIGDNCRLILCGDELQCDFTRRHEDLPCSNILNILEKMTSVKTVNFTVSDIVRSGFCREYLIARQNYFLYKDHDPNTTRANHQVPQMPIRYGQAESCT